MATSLISLLFVLALWRALAAAPRLRETTLLTAQRWAVAALAGWGCVVGVQWWFAADPPAWLDGAWYVAAVLALTAAVAVLGAKRPGVRVWSWFVLLPLVAVFVLPVLAPNWLSSIGWDVQIPLPLMLGIAVVLLMGVGNYVGTRYALPATLYGLAVCLVIAPQSDAAPALAVSTAALRLWGTAALALAVLWGDRQSQRETLARTPLDRLWFDYRETFGIVWGRRLLERVNQQAEAEGWAWRLADDGWALHGLAVGESAASVGTPDSDPRIEHALRWLLRRFVDPAWIDRRLARDSGGA